MHYSDHDHKLRREAAEPIKAIPQQPQVQLDLRMQLEVLHAAANRLGLYDAADYVRDRIREDAS